MDGRLDVLMVVAAEKEIDVMLSVKQLEGRHDILLEYPIGVLPTEGNGRLMWSPKSARNRCSFEVV